MNKIIINSNGTKYTVRLKMIKDIQTCKICGQTFESNLKAVMHFRFQHNLSINQYIEQYFKIPKCKYCDNKVQLYSRPVDAFNRHKRFWHLTCQSKECQTKYNKEVQNNYWSHNEQAKNEARLRRINYLKQKTGKTAWERKAAGEMSYLEQWFFDECIQKYKLYEKYDIINEYCEFPYFIDFAFINLKLAVELDGKCHFIHGETRLDHDKKKDKALNEKGWKIFRIRFDENNLNTINEFLSFISNIECGNKILENRTYKYNEFKKEAKLKNNNWEEYQKKLKLKLFELNKPLIELVKNSNIDFSKFGWVSQVAILIDKKPQKVRQWMTHYMFDFLEDLKKQNKLFTRN